METNKGEDKISTDLKGTEYETVDWIKVAVNTIQQLGGLKKILSWGQFNAFISCDVQSRKLLRKHIQ